MLSESDGNAATEPSVRRHCRLRIRKRRTGRELALRSCRGIRKKLYTDCISDAPNFFARQGHGTAVHVKRTPVSVFSNCSFVLDIPNTLNDCTLLFASFLNIFDRSIMIYFPINVSAIPLTLDLPEPLESEFPPQLPLSAF